jgi:uncharacterized membrane protein YwzB
MPGWYFIVVATLLVLLVAWWVALQAIRWLKE